MKTLFNEIKTENEFSELLKNENTGIEYELALFYKLQFEPVKTKFWESVILRHKNKKVIEKIVSTLNTFALERKLLDCGYKKYTIKITTQDDSVGPADLVISETNKPQLGLSVKYQNNCSINISSKYFLNETSIKALRDMLTYSCRKYVFEMNSKFGDFKNWFRMRKPSESTDEYIDQIRNYVINDWNKKSEIEKKDLLNKLFHADSPINFWIIKILKSKNKLEVDINSEPVKCFQPEKVSLKKVANSYIGFQYDGKLFGKMQVKFNNGILEKAKGKSSDFELKGTKIKYGDPFGSWNFNL